MRLQGYLKETTEPTVKMTLEALKIAFDHVKKVMEAAGDKLFDIDDETAVYLMQKGFDQVAVKVELGKKMRGGVRKYLAQGEFGGNYGKDYAWLIQMLPGFSKVFKRFAKEKDWKNFTNHNKNPLFREMLEMVSHEILHSQQALNSAGAAFDPELQGITYAQQTAIDMIRKGKSVYIPVMRDLFPPSSKVWKKFIKKHKYYYELLKKQGDIVPLKK